MLGARSLSTVRRAALTTLALFSLSSVASCDSDKRDGTPSSEGDGSDGDAVGNANVTSTTQTTTSTSGGFGGSCGQGSCPTGSGSTATGAPSGSGGAQAAAASTTGPYSNTSGGFGGASTGHGGAEACQGRTPMGLGGACSTDSFDIPAVGVDVYVMLDHTLSMENELGNGDSTRWDLTSSSIREFLRVLANDSRYADVGVGVELFSWVDDTDCAFDRFSQPDVEIGSVAQNAQAIDQLLQSDPVGQTPTYTALIGALDHAKDWASAHPDRHTVVVFVTDGDANRCSPTEPGAIASQASGLLQTPPSVPVYFVGIDGSYGLDPVAEATGTKEVLEIMIRDSVSDAVDDFVGILLDIAKPYQPCEFDLPEGFTELGQLELAYQDRFGGSYEVGVLNSANECLSSLSGGFYFSGWTLSGEPSRVTLCPCTCSALQDTSVVLRAACEADAL